MLTRIKNAASFYKDEFKREGAKELAMLHAAATTKPAFAYMGWVGHNNLGDEILYEAHVALFPELHVVPFRPSRLERAISRAQKHPVYRAGILGGGTLINQSSSWLDKIAVIQAQGLPVFCLGSGVTETSFRAGHEQTSMEQWVTALESFKFVGIRGPYSQKMLQDAGFTAAEIVGDTALSLAETTYTPRVANNVIGFNYGLVKENQIWGDGDTYTQNIVAAIKQLIKDGYEVRLLPVWDKDIPSNKALLKLVDDPKCTMRLAFDSLANYSRELEQCELFIGQKLHATIMACMRRIPSIMIEYQPKCRDFMASVDMEDYIIKTSECTPEALLALLARVQQNSVAIQQTLDERVMHYRTIQFAKAAELTRQFTNV
jgi:polysaccharide pyruvyl transferase WcaK-like protein